MRFEKALKAMRKGKKVKRPNSLTIFSLNNGTLFKYEPLYGYSKVYLFLESFILAEDWEVVEDEF